MLYHRGQGREESISNRIQLQTAPLLTQCSRPTQEASGRVVITSHPIEYLLYVLDTVLSTFRESSSDLISATAAVGKNGNSTALALLPEPELIQDSWLPFQCPFPYAFSLAQTI